MLPLQDKSAAITDLIEPAGENKGQRNRFAEAIKNARRQDKHKAFILIPCVFIYTSSLHFKTFTSSFPSAGDPTHPGKIQYPESAGKPKQNAHKRYHQDL